MLGRMVIFGASEIEAHDPTVLECHRQLGDTQAGLRSHVADPADDQAGPDVVLTFRPLHAVQDGLDDLIQAQAPVCVQDWRVADL